jgi:hypothetical protein
MTPDERNMLQQFIGDLNQGPRPAKDPEADAMIHQALQANPDAAYLLVQHAIIADQALQAAQVQIEQMQAQIGPPAQQGSFLGGPQYQQPPYPPADDQGQRPAPSGPFSANSGLGGFLRTAGTMVAGVAGGEFLAQGLSNLFAPRDW